MLASFPMLRGDAGTYLTLGLMRSRVLSDMAHPLVRKLAGSIASGVGSKDGTAQAIAIREYLEDHTQFLRDPDGAEMLHSPLLLVRQLLTTGRVYVDCDDVAMLAACLGKSVGLKARFIVVGFISPNSPYRHVWTELRSPTGGPWIECDVTRPAQGIESSAITRRLVWGV
jgi:transglutaminase-like putative cysteine protease